MKKTRKYLDSFVEINTKDMTEEEWLKSRQSAIGGSDASAVIGFNPWKSALEVYFDKKEENPKSKQSFRMTLGHKLEGMVAELFTEETGLKVRNVNRVLKNNKYPFALANIDRAVVGEKAFLECKTTNSYAVKDWEDDKIPIQYEIQCMHYMAVTGATHCYIAVLIGNEKFVYKKIERDEETIKEIMNLEEKFWNENVLKDVLPGPDGSNAYSEYLSERYKRSEDKEIDISYMKDIENMLTRYDEIKADIKDLSDEKKRIEQVIQNEMKEAERATVGDRKVSWKTQNRTSIDSKRLKAEMPEIAEQYSKTSSYRAFRIK